MPPSCDVAVISYNDVGNFGDRLGYHIVNSLLPSTRQRASSDVPQSAGGARDL